MKKKLFGYLVMALAIMSTGLIGSCRDYDEDVFRVKQELKDADQDLKQAFMNADQELWDTVNARYARLVAAQNACKTSCTNKFNDLKARVDSCSNAAKAQAVEDGKLLDSISSVANNLAAMQSKINAVMDSAESALARAAAALNDAAVAQDSAERALDSINNIRATADAALAAGTAAGVAAVAAQTAADNAQTAANNAQSTADNAQAAADSAKTAADSAKTAADAAQAAADAAQAAADSALVAAAAALDSAAVAQAAADSALASIETLEQEVTDLEKRVAALENVEQKRITSLYVQGALNPTFGYFALPGGIKSNILMAYYGEAMYDAEFPAIALSSPSSPFFYDDPSAAMLQAAEVSRLGGFSSIPTQSISQTDVILSDSANNLGKLYLTINPNEVVIDSTYTFKFVNSLGEESKAKIGALTPSADKLQFGYTTRAGVNAPNGFYEAPVSVDPDSVEFLKPEINVTKDQLVSIAQKLRHRQLDLSGIAGAVYDLFQTKLDAYAVNTSWSDSLGTHNITSYYDLAIAAVKPLSYSALAGMGAGRSIPRINPINDLSISAGSIPSFHFDTVTIAGTTISIDTVRLTTFGDIEVVYRMPESVNTSTGAITWQNDTTVVNLNNIKRSIQNDLNMFTNAAGVDITTEVNILIARIQNQVNTMLRSTEADLNRSVTDYVNSLTSRINSAANSYISRLNTVINKINAVTNKFNAVLSNYGAGAILQPALIYEGADGAMHPMSNDAAHPSVFNGVGGSIILYPTSYSAELLAPAYLKYVAIVDIQNGGASAASVDNSQYGSYFNKVIEGGRYGIDFTPTTAGTYVIYYSAIDYDGRIVADRYYVTVQ